MSERILLRRALSNRQQSPMKKQSNRPATRVGEVVGGAAAVCCCCPFGIANFLVLAIYKVPASLCRRALRKKRRQRLIKKGLWPPKRSGCSCGCNETEVHFHSMCLDEDWIDLGMETSPELDKEVEELEKEMWDTFFGTGFWRTPSQRLKDSAESLPSISNSNLQVSVTLER